MTSPLVLITGGSSGIGQALAARYHREGYRLALVARRVEAVESWAAGAGIDRSRLGVYRADVRDIDALGAAARACLERQGLPDIVVANAGISVGIDTSIREDLEVLRALYETNNLGVAATFQPFISAMTMRRSGTLVCIASVAGIRGLPGHAGYCSSKAAVISYCESLRGDLRGTGVRVVTLLPGYVDTPLTRANRYPMPFMLSAAAFADRAYPSIRAGRSYRVIPWQMGVVAWLMRGLPNGLFDRLAAGRGRKRRLGE